MFTAVLFTVAKRLKQYKCALIDELINKMSYTYTMENNCTLKRRTSDTCYNMDELWEPYVK